MTRAKLSKAQAMVEVWHSQRGCGKRAWAQASSLTLCSLRLIAGLRALHTAGRDGDSNGREMAGHV